MIIISPLIKHHSSFELPIIELRTDWYSPFVTPCSFVYVIMLFLMLFLQIDFHNNLIDTFMEALPHSQAKYLQSSDSSSISMISSIEVNENSCIIPPSRYVLFISHNILLWKWWDS